MLSPLNAVDGASRRRLLIVVGAVIASVVVALALQHLFGRPGSGRRSAARPEVPVVTETARLETFSVRRRTIGVLESPAVVVIRSRIDSQILEQHVRDGQVVRKGELMFKLDDRELKAQVARDQATLAKDVAAQTQARGQLERTQQLVPRGVSTPQQLEQAQAAYAAAQQTVEADRAVIDADRLRLGYATIEAPMDGRLGTVRVAPGNLVSSGDSAGIVTITRVKELRVGFTLPEGDLDALRATFRRKSAGQVSIFTSASGSEPAAQGTLDFVDSAVDQSSGTIAASATIPNETYALWPGQFVDVEIELSSRPDTVMLPSPAIIMGQKGPYVFIAGSSGTVETRPVKVGGMSGARVAIIDGVSAGERVVVEGQSRLSPGSRWREEKPAAPVASDGEGSAQRGAQGAP